jgi:transcriptional regulator with XRE-family HTH domain
MAKNERNLGAQLCRARLKNDLTQGDLAHRLKVSQATISNWEKGKGEPNEEQQATLTHILGLARMNRKHATEDSPSEEGPSPLGTWLNRTRVEHQFSVYELADSSGVTPPTIYAIESGRIGNPRRKTVELLEKALGEKFPSDAAEELAEDAKIEGLGELINFNPYSEDEIPTGPGVYVFYDLSSRPMYVGQSEDMKRRIREHKDKFWFKAPIVEIGAYVSISDNRLRRQVETLLVRFLKSNAVLNRQNVDR